MVSDLNNIEGHYNSFYKNKDWKVNKAIAKKKVKVFLKIINKYAESKIYNIVDAGCGTGIYSYIIQSLGYNVYGFDISAQAINKAKEKYAQIDFRKLDGNDLSYSKETIDLFFAKGFSPFNTSDYNSTTRLLDYWHRFLSKKGVVCVITKSDFSNKKPTGWLFLSEENLKRLYSGSKYSRRIIYLFPPFWVFLSLFKPTRSLIEFLSFISKYIFVKILRMPVTVFILLMKDV